MLTNTLAAVRSVYERSPHHVDNIALYRSLKQQDLLSDDIRMVGRERAPVDVGKRQVRWVQQTLKHLGVIERVPGQRAAWRLTENHSKSLNEARPGKVLVAYQTGLGIALWADNQDIGVIDTPIQLCFTSPPYPLRKARRYGNPKLHQYLDFLLNHLTPYVERLSATGSLVLNLGQDIFEPGSPARSTYIERLVISLEDELGLSLMDRIIWHNPCKPPGPTYYACVKPVQMVASYEPILWLAKDPSKVFSNNRAILTEHKPAMKNLIDKGGVKSRASYGDGAYQRRPGSFGNATEGALPRNVISLAHNCHDTRLIHAEADRLKLHRHGATMPTSLPQRFVDFLTRKEDLVVDLFAGYNKTGLAAERSGRRWVTIEKHLDPLAASAVMFRQAMNFKASKFLLPPPKQEQLILEIG